MDQGKWRQIEELYHACREQEPAQRAGFLREETKGDDELRSSVEYLLAQDGDSSDLLDSPVVELAADLLAVHPAESLAAGMRLGAYEILAPIGAGGMGEVYRAKDTKLGREAAIKVLPHALAGDPQGLARFKREARVLASLNHPNIATIYGLEEWAGGMAIAMELVDGETLKSPLPLETALTYAKQIAEALEAAHERGIAHRDLKPANVMVTPAGVAKVLDFGLARVTGSASADGQELPTATMAEPGTVAGTPAYMAPEQVTGGLVDRRADIWAFGVVLWKMLTGKNLFEGDSLAHVFANVLKSEIDYNKIPAGTPRSIRELLKRCLDRDVKSRLQSIGEARITIQKYLSNPAAEEEEHGPSRRQAGIGSVHWLAWVAVGVLTAGLSALAAVHFREKTPEVVKLQVPPPEGLAFKQTYGPPAVSPDGHHMVFLADGDGKNMLWVRDLDSDTARALPGTENARLPFWSPDNRDLGFFASGKLQRIDITGGPAIPLSDSQEEVGGSWSRDGVIVFGIAAKGLFQVPAGGGVAKVLTVVDKSLGETAHALPWFLPDGRHFLFTDVLTRVEDSAVYVGDLDSQERSLVLKVASNVQYVNSGHILFARAGSLMAQPFDAGGMKVTGDAEVLADQVSFLSRSFGYFSASQTGVVAYTAAASAPVLQLTWFDRTGKPVGTVGKPANIQAPRLSPDEKTVATDRQEKGAYTRDIWLLDLVRGTEHRLTSEGTNWYPVWSPDGTRIAYSQRPSNQVMMKAADGSGAAEALEPGYQLPMDWTRDGRYLITGTTDTFPKTGNDLWALPLSPGRPVATGKPVALRNTEFNEWHGRVSPDGRWLAYQSNESNRDEIYVVSFPELKGHYQISLDGGRLPVWSRDGRELYFVGLDGKMMAVSLKPGPVLDAGSPRPLFEVRLGSSYPSYDVSTDGRFLIATPVAQSKNVLITVVLNWPRLLKK